MSPACCSRMEREKARRTGLVTDHRAGGPQGRWAPRRRTGP